ncbi:hypothetical protein PA905_26110 [Planktothrix agardhii CCAP 1459/11A]|uniref:DUF4276 domain-containing protein n=1 Tax=Planktothrix agardhii CCAP 1459/11A TaxID=282420 RepID=A0A4P5ZX52_PLAAG|nr:DUF4276 family protein [Planktothrix agardhii]GDZ94655.1 hypothetical protein PA905_26110 [Planktothrix agardhii CCAP 1459/11A]
MVEIRIYVEGGGDGKESKAAFREGMSKFLKRLTGEQQQIKITCVVCGSRNAAHRNFTHDLTSHPDAINLLLVDSEDFVRVSSARQHLMNRDSWDDLSGIDENDIHLMVQVMESWLIADIDTLANYYGQGFNRNAIPRNNNVEQISKAQIESTLKRATQRTKKGEYHKIKHGPKILAMIDVSIVRERSFYCDRLFRRITNIGG